VADGRRYASARVLARWYSEPLVTAELPLDAGDAEPEQLARALWPRVKPLLSARLAAAGEPVPPGLPSGGLRVTGCPPHLRRRADVLADAPAASVIVCTRDRAERLPQCLDAAAALDYPDFEIIVVDNAPTTTDVADLVSGRRQTVATRYVVEHRPGLSWARNAGLSAAAGRMVAFLDDDERPDRHWLAELACGFRAAPGVAGVSGIILSVSLDTPAQCWFEQFGGHSKGRGFTAQIFDAASHRDQHPLYPLPPFGAGGNMAFDRAALEAIGGFDVALGTGTPARAGEDTAAICDLMLSGRTFVYWPGAIIWHEHRREFGGLERQLLGYGTGLTAFYTRALLRHPAVLPTLVRLLTTRAWHDMRARDSVRTASMTADYPAALRRATRRGMLAGPGRYLASRRAQARVAAR
jgi:glycosyltransferase involved in cell wall biosynthesis